MTLRYRLEVAAGKTPILEIEGDFWAAHCKVLEAMGIKDLGPVVDEKHASEIARIAKRRYLDSVAQGAENGKRLGKTSNAKR